MDAKAYTAALAELRGVRDQIKKTEATLAKLTADRDKKVRALGGHDKAKAERIAPASGLSVADVVALVPRLGPPRPATTPEPPSAGAALTQGRMGPKDSSEGREGAVAVLPVPQPAPGLAAAPAAAEEPPVAARPRADAEEPSTEEDTPAAAGAPAAPPVAPAAVAAAATVGEVRVLPSIPAGEPGDAWCTPAAGLASTRPTFTQQARQMVFLDTATGVLVHRDGTARLNLGGGSAGEILTAVYAVVPDSVERIYVTGGDPWHRDADRHAFLRDAVAAWLNAPMPGGWRVESTRGKDRLAGHLVHPRNPVGRWQRGRQHTEIRSVGEWFEPGAADPAVVRDAFVLLWRELHRRWPDVVLMGSPSQTGRDLWSRTIPAKAGARWAEGYPVMSQEIRGLLHATAGQGRTELFTPPRVSEKLPQLVELDRTFAYAKHCWASGVGPPRRVTATAFANMTAKEQTDALFAPSHWQVRVTVPDDWTHVGLLPAPAPGDRAWHYPAEPGRTFTTWAGGAEINLALRNPLSPWRIEILDGLLWESGTPLREWATRLKDAWAALTTLSRMHGDPAQRTAAHLASRAVRSILLYGIGGFAQRPRITTGSTPVGQEAEVPAGAEIIGTDGQHITWRRHAGFSRDPYAHPEWAAGVWSGARAALLSTKMRQDDVHVGALHLPPESIVAFRTDAIYTTAAPNWPYHGRPGDYLLKGHLPGPVTSPHSEEELLVLQELGRAHLAEQQEAGR